MGRVGLIALAALILAACGGGGGEVARPRPGADALAERVVWDFEHAVLDGKDAFLALFDFAAVGEMEILLHRYDALGRLPGITEAQIAEYLAEDGTPYPPERERRNVGGFYDRLIRPAIGGGNCAAVTPTWGYNRQLGTPFEPLPAGHDSHEPLRVKVNAYLEDGRGGVIGVRCPGGTRGLALVYTRRDNERGYDLITIYDDGPG
jgi:hypothetical protein